MLSILKKICLTGLGLALLNTSSFGDSQVIVDLGNLVIKSGSNVSRSSPNAIDAGIAYTYAVSGSAQGIGDHFSALLSGTTIAGILEQIKPGASDGLTGTLFNVEGVLPVGVFNKNISGQFDLPFGQRVIAKAVLDFGVTASGTATFGVANVLFKGPSFAYNSTDGIQFLPGANVTLTAADSPSSTPQADLVIVTPSGLTFVERAGSNDIYETTGTSQTFIARKLKKGKKTTFTFLLQNDDDGPGNDTLTLKASADPALKITKVLLGDNTNVTAEVTGTVGRVFSNVVPGDTTLIKVTVKGRQKGANQFLTLTGTATGGGVTDAVRIGLKVK